MAERRFVLKVVTTVVDEMRSGSQEWATTCAAELASITNGDVPTMETGVPVLPAQDSDMGERIELDAIVEGGAVEALVSLIQSVQATSDAHEAAALALGNLCTTGTAAHREYVVAANAVPGLVSLLQWGQDQSRAKAAWALAAIVKGGHYEDFVAAGGITTMVLLLQESIETTKSDSDLIARFGETATRTLGALAPSYATAIVEAGALEPLTWLSKAGSPFESELACWTLEMLSQTCEVRDKVMNADAVPFLIDIMLTGTDTARAHAASTLANLVRGPGGYNDENANSDAPWPELDFTLKITLDEGRAHVRRRDAIFAEGAIDVCLQMLKRKATKKGAGKSVAAAARLLGHFAEDEACRAEMVAAGAVTILSGLLPEGRPIAVRQSAQAALKQIWPGATSLLWSGTPTRDARGVQGSATVVSSSLGLSHLMSQAPVCGVLARIAAYKQPVDVMPSLRHIARELWDNGLYRPVHLDRTLVPYEGQTRRRFLETVAKASLASYPCVMFYHRHTPHSFEECEYWVWKENPANPTNDAENVNLVAALRDYMKDVQAVLQLKELTYI